MKKIVMFVFVGCFFLSGCIHLVNEGSPDKLVFKELPQDTCPTCPACPDCPTCEVPATLTQPPTSTSIPPTHTSTLVPPTSTPVTPTLTSTSVPPTHTPTLVPPTSTPVTPTLTSTSVPPTHTPVTPTLTVPVFAYTYKVQDSNPLYSQNFTHPTEGCNWLGVSGQVFSKSNLPITNLVIHIWGSIGMSSVDSVALTGHPEGIEYGPGGYEITLSNLLLDSTDKLFVQLLDLNAKPLSAITPFSTYADCAKNLIIINFVPIP